MWTEREDNILKLLYAKHSQFYGARWHGSLHYRIARDMRKYYGFHRTESAVARRCFRLGLKIYHISGGEKICKCIECGKAFVTFERYVTRKKGKQKYCKACALGHKYDWNKKHRKEVLKYHQDYNKMYTKIRMENQRKRREKVE
jgi:hypothetical protein